MKPHPVSGLAPASAFPDHVEWTLSRPARRACRHRCRALRGTSVSHTPRLLPTALGPVGGGLFCAPASRSVTERVGPTCRPHLYKWGRGHAIPGAALGPGQTCPIWTGPSVRTVGPCPPGAPRVPRQPFLNLHLARAAGVCDTQTPNRVSTGTWLLPRVPAKRWHPWDVQHLFQALRILCKGTGDSDGSRLLSLIPEHLLAWVTNIPLLLERDRQYPWGLRMPRSSGAGGGGAGPVLGQPAPQPTLVPRGLGHC